MSFALFPFIYLNQKRKPVLSFVTQESDFKLDNSNKFSVEIQEGDSVYIYTCIHVHDQY